MMRAADTDAPARDVTLAPPCNAKTARKRYEIPKQIRGCNASNASNASPPRARARARTGADGCAARTHLDCSNPRVTSVTRVTTQESQENPVTLISPGSVTSVTPALLAALLTRALRGPALAPAHRAAGLIVRRHGYDPRSVPAGLVEAADAIREAIRARVSPDARAGVLVSVIRELLADYPRGLALDAALVRAAAREGVALRETEAIDLLREMAE